MNLAKAIREQNALRRIEAARRHVEKEVARLKELRRAARGVEAVLEFRLATVDRYSGLWWHLLGQLDIVRCNLIEIRSNFRTSPFEREED